MSSPSPEQGRLPLAGSVSIYLNLLYRTQSQSLSGKMLQEKFCCGMGNPTVETVGCLHTERSQPCPRSKRPNAPFSKSCPLRDRSLYSRMMMENFLRRLVFPCLRGLLSRRSIKRLPIRRSLACILMTKDKYVRRVGVKDFCGTSV